MYYNKNKTIIYMYIKENLTAKQIAEETGYILRMVRNIIEKEGYAGYKSTNGTIKKKTSNTSTKKISKPKVLSKEEFMKLVRKDIENRSKIINTEES